MPLFYYMPQSFSRSGMFQHVSTRKESLLWTRTDLYTLVSLGPVVALGSLSDTPESRSQAIDEGYEAFTTTSFDFEPEKGKAEPLRFVGDLWLDIDCRYRPWQ